MYCFESLKYICIFFVIYVYIDIFNYSIITTCTFRPMCVFKVTYTSTGPNCIVHVTAINVRKAGDNDKGTETIKLLFVLLQDKI